MACGVEAEKNDKSFNEILEYLENEENVEIVSGHICNTESIYSLFILLSFFPTIPAWLSTTKSTNML